MSQMSMFTPSAWSVTELTRYVRDLLESDANLQDLWVQGEVSNLSRPSSGHMYFTLKDSNSALRCVMWRNAVGRLEFLPREGDEIEVHGTISVYEASGQYQLYADALRPLGEGALYQQFLRLKARLEAEGLFDEARKRQIPSWPTRVGLVTSPTGAALRDMLNTLRRRYPLVEVALAPTPVQGTEAPPGIVAAIAALNDRVQPDVILVARGGGSIEDLWAFNDERVARAIAASAAPVITGVGHETDFTIADFAADLRAPTPTAAAELATPNVTDLIFALDETGKRLRRTIEGQLNDLRWALTDLRGQLKLRSPLARVRSDRQRVDELSRRSAAALWHAFSLRRSRLDGAARRLEALNPNAVLGRGYAIVSGAGGQVVRSVTQVQVGDGLTVQVSDGRFGAHVEDEKGSSPASSERHG